jgi:hypothetical protein
MEEGTAMSPKGPSSFGIAVFMALALSSCQIMASDRSYTDEEWRWIDKALRVYIGDSGLTKEEILQEVNPVVVYLEESVCVALKLKRSSLGGETTVCFIRDSGALETLYTEGE